LTSRRGSTANGEGGHEELGGPEEEEGTKRRRTTSVLGGAVDNNILLLCHGLSRTFNVSGVKNEKTHSLMKTHERRRFGCRC